jgi:hypothetical protein
MKPAKFCDGASGVPPVQLTPPPILAAGVERKGERGFRDSRIRRS